MTWRMVVGRRPVPARQGQLGFAARAERRERRFKWAIVALTVSLVAGVVGTTPVGRYAARRVAARVKWMVVRSLGLPRDRAEIEADVQLKRKRDIERTTPVFAEVYRESSPKLRRLLDALGMDPAHALLRWGNYHVTLILPSAIFAPDDLRSYRLRPNTRSVWLKAIALPRGLAGSFLAPDTPDLPELIKGSGAFIVPGSVQTTNSWGLRGPEPNVNAPLRGIVLGDSNMQGLFIGDDVTPPECLRRDLESRLKTRASILNTGHLGYSPEQFYHTLQEYGDRFRPHFVLLSFCANDFGDGGAALRGIGDWEEGAYWIGEIHQYCRVRNILCVTTAIPTEMQITTPRGEGYFPGRISDACHLSSLQYCNPVDEFVDEHLRLMIEGERRGGRPSNSPLYNGHLADYHFSPLGAELWGRVLGRRVALLLERSRIHWQKRGNTDAFPPPTQSRAQPSREVR
jgi:uncharacterized membrane protein YtjA (UPF0391 family)